MKPEYSMTSSFGYALKGILTAWREGHNIRIQLCAGILAVVLGFAFDISETEWLAIIICIGLVLGAECFNTAIEDVVDLATDDYHPLAKSAKDMAAGGVLVMALASLAVGLIIFVPHVLALLGV